VVGAGRPADRRPRQGPGGTLVFSGTAGVVGGLDKAVFTLTSRRLQEGKRSALGYDVLPIDACRFKYKASWGAGNDVRAFSADLMSPAELRKLLTSEKNLLDWSRRHPPLSSPW
jgi:hypothetical protein